VSAAKVVAAMEVPGTHQGRVRPERKYSFVLDEARLLNHTPTARASAT
jgi:hypothetical protein